MSSSTADQALAEEQEHVTGLYARLDAARELAVTRRQQAISAPLVDNPQAMGEKEAAVRFHGTRIVQLDAAEAGLVLGRLDREENPQPLYVGRTGLPADDAGGDPALVDWRAPASRPFYTATPFRPEGIARRRHIRTLGRKVTGIDDEVLVLAEGEEADDRGLTGEAALLRALTAERTGRMTDIVRTIQAEQDAIIRSDSRGILVVQGGPGTGKTAVALHRAAYLLYTHRDRLARSGLLVVGPTPTFLRYIADVLPALGETGVVMAGLGDLRPGLSTTRVDEPAVAEVKGRLAMAEVVANAVKDRQGVLRGTRELVIDRERIRLRAGDIARVRTQARRASRLHNLARPAFYRGLVDLLAQRVADRLGSDVRGGENLLDAEDRRALRREIAGEPAVVDLVEELWPLLTPEDLLRDLFSSPERLARAAKGLPTPTARCWCATPTPPGRCPTSRCWRRPTSCSGSTTRPSGPPRRGAGRRGWTRRSGCWTCCTAPGRTTRTTTRSPRSCWPATCWTPRGWPPAPTRPTTAPPPSGPPPTAPGRSGTWWSTRRRSCRRWPGGCWPASARRCR